MASVQPELESLSQTPRVVEFVDCLGDSVVRMQHIGRPTKKSASVLYLPLAILCFLIAGTSFFSAVSVASKNKQELHAHVQAGEAAHSFRPKKISSIASWTAGLSSLAAVAFSLAFLAARRRDEDAVFALDSGDTTLNMLQVTERGAQVLLPAQMNVSLLTDEETLDANMMCAKGLATRDPLGRLQLELGIAQTIRAGHGDRVIHMRWTTKPRSKALAARLNLDSRLAAYVGGTAAAAILLLGLLRSMPVEQGMLGGERFGPSARFIAINAAAMEQALEPEQDSGQGEMSGETAVAEASEAGTRGTTGIETATAERAQMQIKDRNSSPQASRKQVLAAATHSGILGVMREQQLFAQVTATANFASGDGIADWYGGINDGPVGHQVGSLTGAWGNDVTGMGQWGTVKVGNRIGHLSITGRCGSVGCERGDGGNLTMRKRNAGRPVLKFGGAVASGGLDRSIIRRHIKRVKLRIAHCYEKRLLAAPKLQGTLTASFSIGGNGKVIGSSAQGMQDTPLQECVANVVAGIEFPSTQGGTVVNVRYPFTFHSVN